MNHPKPKYRIEQQIVGRTSTNSKLSNQIFLVEINSARYDTHYGHWIYCGTVWHAEDSGDNGIEVEIYEYDVEYRFKGAK